MPTRKNKLSRESGLVFTGRKRYKTSFSGSKNMGQRKLEK
jgi:hypothetical protein